MEEAEKLFTFSKNQVKQAEEQLKKKDGLALIADYQERTQESLCLEMASFLIFLL